MLANPVNTHVNHERIGFTYEPGLYPFNFMPYDCGMDAYMKGNLLLWADNEYHAKQIVIDMLRWYLDQDHDESSNEYVQSTFKFNISVIRSWYDKRDMIKCIPVPTNQMYKLAWATNDRFF